MADHRTPDCFDHLRAAYADGLAGLPFTPPAYTPFRAKMAPQEDAFIAWCEGRDVRADHERELDCMHLAGSAEYGPSAVDRAVAMQPHAWGRAA